MSQRSASEIERDLDRTREEMGQTLDALQQRLSPGQLLEQGMRYFSSGGGRSFTEGASEFAQNLGRSIRDNPIPFALVATGLVWMMLSRGRQGRHEVYGDYEDYDAFEDYGDYPEEEYPQDEPLAGDWRARYGSTGEQYALTSKVETPAAATADAPDPFSRTSETTPPRTGFGGSVGAASVGEQRAQEAARQAEIASGPERREHDREATRRAYEAAEEARRQAMRAARAEDEGGEPGDDEYDEGLRGRLGAAREWAGETMRGTRERVQGAVESTRRRLVGRRQIAGSSRSVMQRTRGGFSRMLQDQPLLVGAIGLAIGAALGAALPRTRREDEWLGEAGDEMKHRAQRIARRAYETARSEAERQHLTPEGARRAAEEVARDASKAAAERIRRAATESVQDIQEAAGSKLKDVESRMREVGDAVSEAAKEEAQRQNVIGRSDDSSSSGKPGSEAKDEAQRQKMAGRSEDSPFGKPGSGSGEQKQV